VTSYAASIIAPRITQRYIRLYVTAV